MPDYAHRSCRVERTSLRPCAGECCVASLESLARRTRSQVDIIHATWYAARALFFMSRLMSLLCSFVKSLDQWPQAAKT
jgi:hypothetical protein